MKKSYIVRALLCACSLLLTVPAFAQDVTVKTGDKIAFLGDSITQFGFQKPLGFVNLVMAGLAANDIKAIPVPAGVSGNMSNDMLARVDRSVISQKPQWMTLSCGVNDVWHKPGIDLETYKTNITTIVDKATAANIKVVLLTATPIYEDLKNPLNEKSVPYNDFLRSLAKEKNLPLADLNADFRNALTALPADTKKGNAFTVDGVHMNWTGDQMMATGVLHAFGLNADQLKKATDSWPNMPVNPIVATVPYSLNQINKLNEVAQQQNRPLNDLINEALKKYVDSLLTTAPVH